MKNKGIREAVKCNRLAIKNGCALHSSFSFLTSPYSKNKMYQKMQREKLYNLHKSAYFIGAPFVFKMNRILSDQISTLQKWHLFSYQMNSLFFLFHRFIIVVLFVNCRAFHAVYCGIFCFSNRAKGCKLRLVIVANLLHLTASRMPLLFIFFQIYLKQVLVSVIYSFVENFKHSLLVIKRTLITGIIGATS